MTVVPIARLLVVNSNTTASTTERVAAAVRAILPECAVTGVTAAYGPRGIGGRSDLVISALATLEALAANAAGHDAAIIACFSDPGLAAARELLTMPVAGIGEASLLTAAQLGARFAVVTVGRRVVPIIEEAVRAAGLESRFAGVTIVDDGALTAADPCRYLREGVVGAARAGAEVAILGGAAFGGLAKSVGAETDIPVIGSVEAGAVQAFALARLGACKARTGSYSAPDRKPMRGLSSALAERLAAEGAA